MTTTNRHCLNFGDEPGFVVKDCENTGTEPKCDLCAARDLTALRSDLAEAKAALGQARELLHSARGLIHWMLGSHDFAPNGQAHEGWLKQGPMLLRALDVALANPRLFRRKG